MIRRIELIVILLSCCCWGCNSDQGASPPKEYKILRSGAPDELLIRPTGARYEIQIAPWEKGHQVTVLPKTEGDMEVFQSKTMKFWIEGSEVKVEVVDQRVIDVDLEKLDG